MYLRFNYIFLFLYISSGCSVLDTPNAHNQPYCVIVKDIKAVKQFMEFEGIDFDEIWIPKKENIKGLQYSLRNYLNETTKISTWTWIDREYILSNISRYNLEYSGFIKDGTQYIICNMVLFSEHLNKGNIERFSIIMDGGCGVVRVIFALKSKSVVRIDCNGEA